MDLQCRPVPGACCTTQRHTTILIPSGQSDFCLKSQIWIHIRLYLDSGDGELSLKLPPCQNSGLLLSPRACRICPGIFPVVNGPS